MKKINGMTGDWPDDVEKACFVNDKELFKANGELRYPNGNF